MSEKDIIEGLELVQGWDEKSRAALVQKVREFSAVASALGSHYAPDAREVALIAMTVRKGK